MNETYIIGFLLALVQGIFFLWVRTSITSQKELTTSISELTKEISNLQLNTAKGYVSKSDMRDFIDRNDKVLSELKQHLITKHPL